MFKMYASNELLTSYVHSWLMDGQDVAIICWPITPVCKPYAIKPSYV